MIIKKRGFTLIEIIISLAMLSILALVFTSVFTDGYIDICLSGSKSKAMADAQSYIDKVWYEGENGVITSVNYSTEIESLLGSSSYCDDTSELHVYSTGVNNLKYYLSPAETIDGKTYLNLEVVVFYFNGKRNVSLSSLIPVGGI